MSMHASTVYKRVNDLGSVQSGYFIRFIGGRCWI
jgi:hypothetical protein